VSEIKELVNLAQNFL